MTNPNLDVKALADKIAKWNIHQFATDYLTDAEFDLLISTLRLASQQEALTHETAKIAAEAIKDYADNNLSMMEACDMETGKAEQIYRAARLLLEMLDGKFPDASQREDVEADLEIMKDMYCKISNVVGRKGTEKEGLDVQVARLIAQREDDREAIARIIDPDAFNATTTKHWTSSWIIKRQREARERADAIIRSLPSREAIIEDKSK